MPLPPDVLHEIFDHLATYRAGFYADAGVDGTITLRVYATGPKLVLQCTVSPEAADEQLLHDLEAFAERQRQRAALRLA